MLLHSEEMNFTEVMVAQYEGYGELIDHDGDARKCTFVVSQHARGHVLITVELDGLSPDLTFAQPEIRRLEGETKDGRYVETAGRLWTRGTSMNESTSTIELAAKSVSVGVSEESRVDRVRYDVTNFNCRQTQDFRVTLPNRGETCVVRYEPYDDVKDRVRWYSFVKSVGKTGEFIVSVENSELGKIDDVVKTLCRLCSIASGTRVSYRQRVDFADGREVHRHHFEWVQKPFSSRPVIDPRKPGSIKTFVETCWDRFEQVSEELTINHLIDAWVDSRSQVDFLQSRGVKTATALEMLKDTYLSCRPKREFVLDGSRSQRDKVSREIRNVLRNHIELPEDELKEMLSGVPALHRRSFRTLLNEAADLWDVDVTNEELQRVVKNRNSLLHRGDFTPSSKRYSDSGGAWRIREHLLLSSVLDRFLLGILKYKGPFLDWTGPDGPTRRELE